MTTTETAPFNAEDLKYGAQEVQSREYDWSRGYGETYQSCAGDHLDCENRVECPECEGTGGDINVQGGVEVHTCSCGGDGWITCPFDGPVLVRSGLIECPECGDEVESDSDEPKMNYFYALPSHGHFDSNDAIKLADLPLCLVNFPTSFYDEGADESLPEWALALTGGGMDLSWQIAEAYCRLGYLPPAFVCDLPRMAGMDYSSPTNSQIVIACKRSMRSIRDHAERSLEKLDGLYPYG